MFGVAGASAQRRILQLVVTPLEICIMFLDGVRLHVANQSVLVDAAIIPSTPGSNSSIYVCHWPCAPKKEEV
jgi:hypothetical protein